MVAMSKTPLTLNRRTKCIGNVCASEFEIALRFAEITIFRIQNRKMGTGYPGWQPEKRVIAPEPLFIDRQHFRIQYHIDVMKEEESDGFRALGMAAVSATALLAGALPAQSTDATGPSAQGDVSVTIYNNGQALVQDVRQLPIAAGRSRIEFPDVSAMIRPETLSFAAADHRDRRAEFRFRPADPGQIDGKGDRAGGDAAAHQSRDRHRNPRTRDVLSTAGGVVVKIGERIEVLRDDDLPVRVIFDRVPPNLRARPTLSVTVDSGKAGSRPASIRYLTPGLGWAADYVALYDEGKSTVDVQGWVTLTNNTGTTFSNANTLLVAGSPRPRKMATTITIMRRARYRAGASRPERRARTVSSSAISISTRSPGGPRSPTPRPSR